MSDRPKDDREALRALWNQLEAPSPDDGGDQSRDPRTQAALSWMHEAWQALECPPTPSRRRGRRLRFPPALAAVAAILLALIGALAFDQGPTIPESDGREVARDQPIEVEESHPSAATDLAMTRRVTPSGDLEMKKGRVRLLLVTPEPNPPEAPKEK